MEKYKKTLTIFTPSYNRAYAINRCYESLCRQSCKDFIWLIIDDGSTDNTRDLVNNWMLFDNGFEIKYFYKKNGGMHTAHNTAYELVDTELNVCIDSDDYMTDDAVQKIIDLWKQERKNKYVCGIIALDVDIDGNIIGTQLPKTEKYTTLNGFYSGGGRGDKKLIYRTEVMKKYPPYPVFGDEKYISLSYKYSMADKEYVLRVLNEPVCIVEYQKDGSSRNMYIQYRKSPMGFAFIRKQGMLDSSSFKEVFRNCIHYVSSSLIIKNRRFIHDSPKKFSTIIAIPFGILLTILIYIKTEFCHSKQ